MVELKTLTTVGAISGIGMYSAAIYTRNRLFQSENEPPAQSLAPPGNVSIIIKNLNEEVFVGKCIESLLDQSIIQEYPDNFEIILVDGGSDDRSVEIARQYPIKIVETTKGILHQMNTGVENSSGDIIVFVDADSTYPIYWLAKILSGFTEGVAMVHTSFLYEDEDTLLWGLGMFFHGLLMAANGGGTAVRRKVFEEKGMFDESQDCVYLARVFQEAEINNVQRALSVGGIVYQWDNPFITTARRHKLETVQHQCVRNPGGPNCKFAQEVGVTRF